MKQLTALFLLIPFLSAAQNKPRFQNDTLYTSCGYKIYVGQTLQFGKASGGRPGKFKHVNIKNAVPGLSLENRSVIVKEIKDFGISVLGNGYITVGGSITFRDGSKGYVEMHMAFDHAIGNYPEIPGELLVPEEFKDPQRTGIAAPLPRFGKDTLFTSSGYKIYVGQTLQFGKMTGDRDRFRYITIRDKIPHTMLQNHTVLVKELSEFGVSALGNGYISIAGILFGNNNEREFIEMRIAFDHAIENLPFIPSELVVPEEFRNTRKFIAEEEMERVEKLFGNGFITKDEFEACKKKLQEMYKAGLTVQ